MFSHKQIIHPGTGEKAYNTTIGVILAANQLETEGDISRDQLLLIPRKRT